jgi:hypothetical protein
MKIDIVDLAEITAIRLKCGTCHAAITVPVGKAAEAVNLSMGKLSERAVSIAQSKCPTCKTPSGFGIASTPELAALAGFFENLERLAAMDKLNLKIQFEIRGAEPEPLPERAA